MFKRMIELLKPGMWGLLVAGCTTKSAPLPAAGSDQAANARKATVHVAGMIERQNIT